MTTRFESVPCSVCQRFRMADSSMPNFIAFSIFVSKLVRYINTETMQTDAYDKD